MTRRERNLLRILAGVTAAAGLLLGINAYLDGIARLDTAYISLQKRALRFLQTALATQSPASALSILDLNDRFFSRESLPNPLSLAARIQTSAKSVGLRILESKITGNSSVSHWIQYDAEGSIESWFGFVQKLRKEDPKSLFRTLSLVKTQGESYIVSFEVGHAVLP